jgi:hypothetical protein
MSTVDNLGIAHAESADSDVASFNRRAPRISQADVFHAADELLLEGHRPTIDRVRMRLGRGSPNTINDHLDAWWAKLGSRLRDLPGQEFPQLPERIAQSLQRLWNEALQSAHETLGETLHEREEALLQREQALDNRARELAECEHAVAARLRTRDQSCTGSRAVGRRQSARRGAQRLWIENRHGRSWPVGALSYG